MHLFQLIPLDQLVLAQAAGGGAPAQPNMMNMLTQMAPLIIAFFGIIYFFQIRPQKQREKEKQKMLDAVTKGDKVITIGGINGTVVNAKEDTVILRVDDNTTIEFERRAINHVHQKSNSDN